MFDRLGRIGVPPWSAIPRYQAYLELVTLPAFRDVLYEDFVEQAERDYPLIRMRLSEEVPVTDELSIPEFLGEKVLVFPSGTARQSIPVPWARAFFPDAAYGFFHKDPEMARFARAGLTTVSFYRQAGDILALARRARAVLTVDSFPSHLLQYGLPESTAILLTELRRERTVSPFFAGAVVESTAPCHPCLHVAKGPGTRCQAGHVECINWLDPGYGLDAQRKIAGLLHGVLT